MPPEPTTEQMSVINAPTDAASLVLAGPGTGKTFTLVRRVQRLVAEGHRPLVLSFTRAVVGELHNRLLHVATGDARYLRPVTFDSFATRLLSALPDLAGWRDWEKSGYDGRIAAAASALEEVPAATAWLQDRFDHVVVDEVQDLVGVRALLVLALLRVIPRFTLLGDPAQGIYGWNDGADQMSADDFLSRVSGTGQHGVATFQLTVNHRALRDDVRELSNFRDDLMDLDRAGGRRGDLLVRLRASDPLGSPESAAHLLPMYRGRTAVLCRTNVEALTMSEILFAAGVDHVVRRSATDRVVAPWLAEVVAERRGALSRAGFVERYENAVLRDGMDADAAWELLTRVSGEDDRVPLDRLADGLRSGRIPDELQAGPDADVIVSTIHRAKGLEFDNVAVVLPPDWRSDTDPAEEARVLFVAMTRTRDGLAHAKQIATFGWQLHSDRWYRTQPGQTWKTLGVELRGDDAHAMHPAGSFLVREPALQVQERLQTRVRRGDAVDLELVHSDDGSAPWASYAVIHPTGTIAVTGEAFGHDLARRLRQKRNSENRWPRAITGLRVEALDSVAGLEGLGQSEGLGAAGVWLRARVVGLGCIDWNQ